MNEEVKNFGAIVLIATAALVIILALSALTGPTSDNVRDEEVSVVIIDTHHRSQTMINGVVTPAESYIEVTYNGISYTIYGYDIYTQYKERIGEEVQAILRTSTFKNGSTRREIIIN